MLLRIVREHWPIENRLHYVRDWTCDEDRCRAHVRHTPRNLACPGNAAISIVRFEGRFQYMPPANRYYAVRAQDAIEAIPKPLKRSWAGWKQNPLSRSARSKDCCARSRQFAGKHPQTLIRDTSVSPDNRSDARARAGIRRN